MFEHLCHFGRYDSKAKLFCQKSFVPVTLAGVFIWEKFHPGYRGGSVAEWFRELVLESGGPRFKASTVPLAGFLSR